MWFQLMVLMTWGMVLFQPSCVKAVFKAYCFHFASWQLVGFFCCLGKIDDKDGLQRDAEFYFMKETIMEITLGGVYFGLGFLAP